MYSSNSVYTNPFVVWRFLMCGGNFHLMGNSDKTFLYKLNSELEKATFLHGQESVLLAALLTTEILIGVENKVPLSRKLPKFHSENVRRD